MRPVLLLALAPALAGASDPAARDALYRHGRVRFRCLNAAHVDPRGAFTPGESWRGEVVFADDGRVVQRIDRPPGQGPDVLSKSFFRGRGFFYDEVRRTTGTEIQFAWGQTLFDPLEKPFPALSLGLGSGPTRKRRTPEGFEYRRIDSGVAETVLVLKADGSPVRLTRALRGKPFDAWRYEGAIRAAPGLVLPKRATLTEFAHGKTTVRTYEFLSIDLDHAPTEAELNPRWPTESLQVIDNRRSPSLLWTGAELRQAAGPGGTVTPEAFLAYRKPPPPGGGGTIMAVIGVAGLGGAGWLLRRAGKNARLG